MIKEASNALEALAENVPTQYRFGVVGAGAVNAPPNIYGEFLTTHGMFGVSLMEQSQLVSYVFISLLLLKATGIFKLMARLHRYVRLLTAPLYSHANWTQHEVDEAKKEGSKLADFFKKKNKGG